MMNDETVEAQNVAERYVLGRLSPEDLLLFEEHLIGCPRCQEAVEASGRLRDALRVLAAQEAAPAPVAGPSRAVAPRPWLNRWPYAAAIVGLLALPVGFLWTELQGARRERDTLRLEATAAERREAEQGESLDRERAARSEAEDRLTRSQGVAPVYALPLTRGGPMSPSDVPTIRVPATPQWIVLALEREEAPPRVLYSATLSTEGDRIVWHAQDLKPISRDLLALSLHSSVLHPGAYLLKLEELDSRNRVVGVRHYPFRVVVP